MEYDKSTGVLMGYNLLLDIDGSIPEYEYSPEIPNKIVDFVIEQKVEAVGFNIGGFGFLGSPPVYTIVLSVFALFITRAVITKRKRKHS